MKILITGSNGFIGSHCARIMDKVHNVVLLDKSSYQLRLNGMFKSVMKKDLSIERDVRGILKGIDVVIHFAAETFVDYSITNPRKFVESNILGTFNLLEEARKSGIKKFILISTDEVYGSSKVGYFHEESALNPGNPYSATKAAVDMIAMSYINTFKLPITILRCENNYGIYQGKEKAIPTWIGKAIKNEPLPLYGDGKHRRMWLRVEDFCSAIETVVENETDFVTYNIGACDEHENIDIVKRILKIMNKPLTLVKLVPDKKIRPGHDFRYAIDNSRILGLGWKPKYFIDKNLEEVVNWYVQNQWWFK